MIWNRGPGRFPRRDHHLPNTSDYTERLLQEHQHAVFLSLMLRYTSLTDFLAEPISVTYVIKSCLPSPPPPKEKRLCLSNWSVHLSIWQWTDLEWLEFFTLVLVAGSGATAVTPGQIIMYQTAQGVVYAAQTPSAALNQERTIFNFQQPATAISIPQPDGGQYNLPCWPGFWWRLGWPLLQAKTKISTEQTRQWMMTQKHDRLSVFFCTKCCLILFCSILLVTCITSSSCFFWGGVLVGGGRVLTFAEGGSQLIHVTDLQGQLRSL